MFEGLATGAILLGIYADLAMNIASATNSSPQTTELFAGERSETLWKWVKIGGVTAVGFGAIGSILSGSIFPLIGTAAVIAVMGLMYKYALKWGKQDSVQTTSYTTSVPSMRLTLV